MNAYNLVITFTDGTGIRGNVNDAKSIVQFKNSADAIGYWLQSNPQIQGNDRKEILSIVCIKEKE